ncbi:MAG: c-type cytochrome [Gemmatimonadota bacterium]|nr:MAG: c-type cytochrome [Gemmatimonadota bacterium]
MSRLNAQAILVGCLLAGVRAAEAQPVELYPGNPAAGRRVFVDRDCDRCHAIWGNGGTLGPDFATAGAGRSLLQLAGLFWNHTPGMIETVRSRGYEWPKFTEAELADIISYIYYVKLFDAPGDPEAGERWFREKRCADCHTVGERGGENPLDHYASYVAPIVLAEGMWNHGPEMQAQQTRRGLSLPIFVAREVADIQAYIREASSIRDRRIELLEPPDPNRGRQLFAAKRCTACHGAAGEGTDYGPDVRMATQRLTVSEIAGRLWNHSTLMWQAMRARGISFPYFEGSEMADLIAFLYYLRFYETEGDVRVGARLYVTKGCAACHGRDQASEAPDLADSGAVLSPLGLATAMWEHAPAMFDMAEQEHREWPRFEGDEMRDLSAYLRSLALERDSAGGGPDE